jgi:hypothetical protein
MPQAVGRARRLALAAGREGAVAAAGPGPRSTRGEGGQGSVASERRACRCACGGAMRACFMFFSLVIITCRPRLLRIVSPPPPSDPPTLPTPLSSTPTDNSQPPWRCACKEGMRESSASRWSALAAALTRKPLAHFPHRPYLPVCARTTTRPYSSYDNAENTISAAALYSCYCFVMVTRVLRVICRDAVEPNPDHPKSHSFRPV